MSHYTSAAAAAADPNRRKVFRRLPMTGSQHNKVPRIFNGMHRPAFIGDWDSPNPISTGNPIKAMTRNEAVMRQMGVNLAVRVPQNETERRASKVAGRGGRMYGPAIGTDADIEPRKGLLGICRLPVRGGTFRTTLGADTPVEVLTNSNGLSMHENLGMAGLCETQVHDGNKQLTLTIHGIDSVVQYGPQRLQVGDRVILDPTANVTHNGTPSVYGAEGIPKMAQNFGMRPMGPMDHHSWIQEMKRLLMATFIDAKKNIDQELQKFVPTDSPNDRGHALFAGMQAVARKAMNTSFHMAPDHPSVAYADMFLAIHFADLFIILSADNPANALYAALSFKGQQAKVMALLEVEKSHMDFVKNFDSYLPTGFKPNRVSTLAGVLESKEVDVLRKAESAEAMVAAGNGNDLMSAMAQINMAAFASISEQETRMRDYLHRFRVGLVLHACETTQNTDVFFGL